MCNCNKNIKVKIKRTDKNIPLPEYTSEGDGCMDIRIVLPRDEVVGGQVTKTSIAPNETKIFDTGLIFEIPDGHVMKIYPRSSTGIKLGIRLANGTGILDSKFRQTCKIALHNFSNSIVFVDHLQRIAQFQVVPFPKMIIEEVEEVTDTARGEGLGSSGKF